MFLKKILSTHVHLVASGLFIFLHPSAQNCHLSLPDVPFLVLLPIRKGFFVMISNSIESVSRNVVVSENQYFFPHFHDSSTYVEYSTIPGFSFDTPSLPNSPPRFKPNCVYAWRTAVLPPPQDPPDLTSGPETEHPFRRSTRNRRPPDRYGFSHTSLLATLSSVTIPTSYS